MSEIGGKLIKKYAITKEQMLPKAMGAIIRNITVVACMVFLYLLKEGEIGDISRKDSEMLSTFLIILAIGFIIGFCFDMFTLLLLRGQELRLLTQGIYGKPYGSFQAVSFPYTDISEVRADKKKGLLIIETQIKQYRFQIADAELACKQVNALAKGSGTEAFEEKIHDIVETANKEYREDKEAEALAKKRKDYRQSGIILLTVAVFLYLMFMIDVHSTFSNFILVMASVLAALGISLIVLSKRK